MKKSRALLLLLLLPWLGFQALDLVFPLPEILPAERFATVVTASDGTPLRAFPDSQGIWRYPVTLEEVSPVYVETLLTYEDRWFWHHPGINPLAILRAAQQNLTSGKIISGASTITMQVARLLFPHSRTLRGKLYQMFRALQLEWHFDKKTILTIYLNRAPFGSTIEGVQAASFSYLGKPATELSDAEAALLAVLPQSPTRLRPDRHPQRAQRARDKVLVRMAQLGDWPQERIQQAQLENVSAIRYPTPLNAPLLSRRLKQQFPQQSLLHTTIDRDLQLHLESQVQQYIANMPDATSAAIMVLENQTHAVRAYVGSADFHNQQRFGHVDMITAIRSPGSTLKPFLYGFAIDKGIIHSASLLSDAPSRFGDYRPQNPILVTKFKFHRDKVWKSRA